MELEERGTVADTGLHTWPPSSRSSEISPPRPSRAGAPLGFCPAAVKGPLGRPGLPAAAIHRAHDDPDTALGIYSGPTAGAT